MIDRTLNFKKRRGEKERTSGLATFLTILKRKFFQSDGFVLSKNE
jgi:hypothetical protein